MVLVRTSYPENSLLLPAELQTTLLKSHGLILILRTWAFEGCVGFCSTTRGKVAGTILVVAGTILPCVDVGSYKIKAK